MNQPAFRAPKGTFDFVPPRGEAILAVRDAMAEPLRHAGYGYIETPSFEETALFARGVGESTDIVTKEMYSFTTRGGDEVTLRPEGTAPVLRAALENGLHRGALPVKLWYSGSYYRYERPQKGRYRHFSQVGAEVLGTEDPAVDAELIVLAMDAYRSLGLTGVHVVVNSLGSEESRPAYRAALQEYLRGLDLDEDTARRVEINPLRVLDDKRPEIQAALADAPVISDFLSAADRSHHDMVRSLLTDAGVPYRDDPRLVRGLDYYTRTLFEFVHEGIGAAQSAVGGGGRYDGLSELIGGPRLPSVGWALGADRTLLAMEAEGLPLPGRSGVDVFAVPLGEEAARTLFGVVAELRRAGVRADMSVGGRGLKGAMKAADRSGARLAVVIGERDLAENVAQVKDLESGEQQGVALADVLGHVTKRLASPA
ncbi:histidine--tRNA ligase [Phytoactinopolyspora halotolerans]|uniref:Histidine--tRNA ligase n=1 Tax=Phytoactinopolyspora halotolerans TaxID=1981512 RepID=A0A6L9S9D8_9ACTN|nr:histidine--tRNA ligase [Phytoactinopolyspora halotolerans]NEE01321.1 histidine--tRNA ligase [Phytoactinopolyspora halotolerans]